MAMKKCLALYQGTSLLVPLSCWKWTIPLCRRLTRIPQSGRSAQN